MDAINSGEPRLNSSDELNAPAQALGGLHARNIGKNFKRRSVLRDVSIQVSRGEAVGLLGPNGASKATWV